MPALCKDDILKLKFGGRRTGFIVKTSCYKSGFTPSFGWLGNCRCKPWKRGITPRKTEAKSQIPGNQGLCTVLG